MESRHATERGESIAKTTRQQRAAKDSVLRGQLRAVTLLIKRRRSKRIESNRRGRSGANGCATREIRGRGAPNNNSIRTSRARTRLSGAAPTAKRRLKNNCSDEGGSAAGVFTCHRHACAVVLFAVAQRELCAQTIECGW